MWLLARVLPLAIADLVPQDDERWINFLRMMDIVDILFSPRVTEDDAALHGAHASSDDSVSTSLVHSTHMQSTMSYN